MKKISIKIMICLMIIASIFGSSYVYAQSQKHHYIPYEENTDAFTTPEKGKPLLNVKMRVWAEEELLFETTCGDYTENREYYNKKFGIEDYWRDNHYPVEPEDIIYKEHYTVKDTPYPIIYIEEQQ